MQQDPVAGPAGVKEGVLCHRQRAGANDEIIDAELYFHRSELLIERAAQCQHRVHRELHGHLVMRDLLLALHQALGNDAAHVGHWNFDALRSVHKGTGAGRGCGHHRRRCGNQLVGRCLCATRRWNCSTSILSRKEHITLHYATAGAGPLHLR